jgi:hypothetical protein
MLELAGKLKIQQLQDILAEQWKPYMQNLTYSGPRSATKSSLKRPK